ncbi:uncharacterized protein [Antedon mediterranea]|uniref:uncharacterized protein isoform X2 n=1 Tax=Antedon mediterranea TaxID=105859 RepID=UPI003AF776A5
MADYWTKERIVEHISTLKDTNTHEKLGQFFDDWAPHYDKLANSGYTNIDAIDGSASSIEVARKKNVYKNLYVQWIGGDNKMDVENDSYDALIIVGAFAFNHLKSDVFPDLIRVTKPGGYIVNNLRARWLKLEASYADGKLEADMEKHEKEGKWKLVERHVKEEEDSDQNVVTFIHQVC